MTYHKTKSNVLRYNSMPDTFYRDGRTEQRSRELDMDRGREGRKGREERREGVREGQSEVRKERDR